MTGKQYTTAAATVENTIKSAWEMNASDIHFEPLKSQLEVKFRIDGQLRTINTINKNLMSESISYIKVMANMRTDEHNLPQDGRFTIKDSAETQSLNIRVSIMPTHYGEKAVLRLLSNHISDKSLSSLGLPADIEQRLNQSLEHSSGMIIVTGPTGSGKTTTLYHCLEYLKNRTGLSITTLEDPVEYAISGITQIPIFETKGFDFKRGLRSLLRQDPDIIMVGEIRDKETARLAIQAALTGHLVLTTLHTTDTITTIPRLVDMGIEPYLITATVKVIISQRLVKKLCSQCKMATVLTDTDRNQIKQLLPESNLDMPDQIYASKGCKSCNGSGYKGRIGVYELLDLSPKIGSAAMQHKNINVMKRIALKEGLTELWVNCWNKVIEGITTIDELIKISHE